VYNLVGRDYPTKYRRLYRYLDLDEILKFDRNFSLEDVHVEGTERIAEAVAKYDVDRYIHVSSHNADINSPSEFFATKVCPGVTLIRMALKHVAAGTR
jgi:NADH dehydrogenase (ubiquinone) 1 alpha subcomplex subunit 9